jgi:hypothetical protein
VLGDEADPTVLRGILGVPRGGREGRLRFGNYVGTTELGGRRLEVCSRRLDASAVAGMLDDVSRWFASLPFGKSAPVGTSYATGRRQSPPVLYHAFAVLRDAFRAVGPYDLIAAMGRVLSDPHETLRPDAPRLSPIGAASAIDADTIEAIPGAPALLQRAAPGSRLAASAVARRTRGMVPELIKVRPFLHSTDNAENRFAVGLLASMLDLLARFERLAQEDGGVAQLANAREARQIASFVTRCLRHPALAALEPRRQVPVRSTTLRSRPGYRDLLRLHYDLLGRLQSGEAHDLQRLLETRNAAEIYEYWCYVQVVEALERLLGPPFERDRFAASDFQAELRWGYRVKWPEVEALYNSTFSRPGDGGPRRGHDSYSLPLRPDIVLRRPDGDLILFDAKLKGRFGAAVAGREDESEDTFKPEDLHKMHAYRDALGAESVWVLFPGDGGDVDRFSADDASRFRGVGAVALRPGAVGGGLESLLGELLEVEAG